MLCQEQLQDKCLVTLHVGLLATGTTSPSEVNAVHWSDHPRSVSPAIEKDPALQRRFQEVIVHERVFGA